jgi:hypothetical protein
VREARRGSAYEGLGGLRAEYRHGWRGRRTQGRDWSALAGRVSTCSISMHSTYLFLMSKLVFVSLPSRCYCFFFSVSVLNWNFNAYEIKCKFLSMEEISNVHCHVWYIFMTYFKPLQHRMPLCRSKRWHALHEGRIPGAKKQRMLGACIKNNSRSRRLLQCIPVAGDLNCCPCTHWKIQKLIASWHRITINNRIEDQ